MKKIIVCAYPKSGSTWLTRLTAELVGCPVDGYWNDPRPGLVNEGENRHSEYRCYQAHHIFNQLQAINDDNTHIIYLIRDPRDIVISGSHHFEFVRFNTLCNLLEKLPKGKGVYNRFIKNIIITHQYRIEKMITAVLFGSNDVNEWCSVSWKNHYQSYLNKSGVIIRYEDLINAPKEQCIKILDYVNVNQAESKIDQAIKNQSFSHKKSTFLSDGEKFKAEHLRVGLANQWRKQLTAKQKSLFIRHLKEEMEFFSYPLY